ncbi:MAG: hypothetical protein ACK4F5_10650 [Aliihoeflea sp.]
MSGRNSMKRTLLTGGLVGLSALALSGCLGPTYGTGKPASEQLLEDVSGAISLAPRRGEPIAYQPRPDLVQPPTTAVLPTPQAPAVETSANWPESPEARLARIRAEATANQENNLYRSPVQMTGTSSASEMDAVDMSQLTPEQQRAEYQRRAAMRAGSATQRRYLSEPPLEYRVPSANAPADELGEDEWRKEQQLRRAAGSSSGWRDWVPWL